jgi:hypothetical protein
MNLELLADRWGLIDRNKYVQYRSNKDLTGKIPTDTFFLHLFDLATFKLGCKTVFTKTAANKKLLIEKEFSLAAAKLF